jgi:hypothetical protein
MRKIPTIFVRAEHDRRFVTSEPHPACDWVFRGEGVPTRKYDGTCVRFDGTSWWARREVRAGRPAPDGFVLVETDDTTGKSVGWEPVAQSPFARFHAEALGAGTGDWAPGTYELVGPKINGNPERAEGHRLIAHSGAEKVDLPERTFDAIRAVTLAARADSGCEGIVFHAPDGRMAKIKARDFPAG